MTSEEFNNIVDSFYEPLYRFAYSLAKEPNGAADLTQQTFYIFAEKGHQIRDRSKVKSWLFTTLHREFLKQRRRSQRMVVVEDTEPLMEVPSTQTSEENARKMDGATVIEALSELEDIYRAPLTLFYLQQVSYKEIAEILDVPIGTVMSRLSRGKDQLRRYITSKDEHPDKVINFPNNSSPTKTKTSSSSNHV